MPKGAKKRKAAKKKKEQENNTNPSTSTNSPQGEHELKFQDEKGSDGGEGGSPSYHNHDDQNQFNEGSEDMEESDPSADVAKSLEEVPNDGKIDEVKGGKENVVVIEWDSKSDESCENKDVSVVQIESAKESNYVNESSGGSIDEIKTGTAENSKDESCNNYVEEIAVFDEVINSVKKSVDSVVESSADSVNVVTSVSEMQRGDTGNVLLDKSMDSQVVESVPAVKINEDVRTLSLEEPETRELESKVLSSVSQSHVQKSTNGAQHVKDSNTAECSEIQPQVVLTPHVVHKTSWLSCCGLFEVLSGSNR